MRRRVRSFDLTNRAWAVSENGVREGDFARQGGT